MIVLVLVACLEPRPSSPSTCGSCHGDASSPAPPQALGWGSSTELVGVGAHRTHMDGASTGVAVACTECHQVPTAVDDEGHVDTPWPAEVIWGDLGKTGGVVGEWDRDALTCSNTYCHGATLTGGLDTAPVWTTVDGSQVQCDSCHGVPPPPPHPSSTACADCHAPTARPDSIDPATHIDGTLDLSMEQDCTGCHGTGESLYPPTDVSGSSDPSDPGVGAHAVHMEGGDRSGGYDCETCHVVPATVDAEGHQDGGEAEVVFSGLATDGGASPSYDPGTRRCSDTYCHGPAEPVWNVVDGSQAACGSCHGIPPGGGHPSSDQCQSCHPPADSPSTFDDPDAHCDGTVDR